VPLGIEVAVAHFDGMVEAIGEHTVILPV
jgi:hypothetical protein